VVACSKCGERVDAESITYDRSRGEVARTEP
jgi:hypothetical protein